MRCKFRGMVFTSVEECVALQFGGISLHEFARRMLGVGDRGRIGIFVYELCMIVDSSPNTMLVNIDDVYIFDRIARSQSCIGV